MRQEKKEEEQTQDTQQKEQTQETEQEEPYEDIEEPIRQGSGRRYVEWAFNIIATCVVGYGGWKAYQYFSAQVC
jgi:hypothetical protein